MKLDREKAPPRPGVATVNLLSQSHLDRLAVRRLRQRFVAAGVVLVLLAGAGWFVQHARVADQEKLIAIEQSQTGRLSAETRTLTSIRTFVTGVAAQKQTVADTMAHEIYFSKVLEGIRQASPSGTSLQLDLGHARHGRGGRRRGRRLGLPWPRPVQHRDHGRLRAAQRNRGQPDRGR